MVIKPGKPSIRISHTEVAAQLHPTKNNGLTAEQIVAGSRKKYWWVCPEGPDHEWDAFVSNRTLNGSGCPCCAGKQVSVTNSLANYPDVAAQLHPTKNEGVTPDQIIAGSNKKYWWKCPEGPDHEWETTAGGRTGRGDGCPSCDGKQLSVTNSLANYPDVAAQLHPTKNEGVTPDQIIAGSNKKYWWKCPEGPDHEWETTAGGRTGRGDGCPSCDGKQLSVTNSLATLFPYVAAQLDPAMNGGINAEQIIAGSHTRFLWKCQNGPDHIWGKKANDRTYGGHGCPKCRLVPRSRPEINLAFELLLFFDYEMDDRKEEIGRQVYDCDIIIRQERLIVEFDSFYWHKNSTRPT